jgi:hypothetical protein
METRLVSGPPTKLQSLCILVIQHLQVDDISTNHCKKKVRVTVVYDRGDIICADGIMDDYRQEEQGPFPNVLPLSLL